MPRRLAAVAAVAVVVGVIVAVAINGGDDVAPIVVAPPPTVQDDEGDPAPRQRRDEAIPRSLLGDVVDGDGDAIGGARVGVVFDDGGVGSVVVTDSDGRFSHNALPRSFQALRFSAPGYVGVDIAFDDLPTLREAHWSQALARDATARIVRIARADGSPHAGARLFRLAPGQPKGIRDAVGVSDAQGRVMVAAGAVDVDDALAFADDEYGSAVVGKDDKAVFSPPGTVRVAVVGERREPMAGAQVLVRSSYEDADSAVLAVAMMQREQSARPTSDDGVVEWVLPAGRAIVDVSSPGFRPIRLVEPLNAGDRLNLVVKLQSSPSVSGVVVDSDSGAPVAGASVSADVAGRASSAVAVTDNEGRFTIASLEDRATSLRVSKRGYRNRYVGGVDGGGSRNNSVEIALSKGSGDEVVGIGITVAEAEGGILVSSVQDGGPAQAAGLLEGDVIVGADGERLDRGLKDAMGRVRGVEDTTVRLDVRRDGAVRRVDVVRAVVRAPRRH
jgi:hypothetical protein